MQITRSRRIYPKTPHGWLNLAFITPQKKEEVFDFIATGDCEACMDDLAKELAFYARAGLLAKERWEIFIHPGERPWKHLQ